MSLRSRLLLGLGAVALVLLVVAAVLIRTTRADLLARVDDQLQSTSSPPAFRRGLGTDRVNPSDGRADRDDRTGDGQTMAPPTGTPSPFVPPGAENNPSTVWIGALVDGDVVTVVPLARNGRNAIPQWDAETREAVRVNHLQTVTGDGTVERFRVLARQGPGDVVYLVAAPLDDVDAAVARLVAVEIAATATVLALLAVVALWVLRLGVQPLKAMTVTATSIGSGDLSARVPEADPRTEAGELGAALNAMMTRIEESFAASAASEARLRRFVADASHELRTPITTIRGYAELHRQGGLEDSTARHTAMARVEQESIRMGSLVEDLLLLARLDEGRPLETGPVEIGSLVDDIRLDTVVAHPNHRIEVSLVGSPEARTVMGDRHRLHQVLANVVGNAVRHTPVGTTVAVKVAPVAVAAGEDDQVEVVIRDDGPGMEPDLAARAFERFARGDLARSRAEGSTGLGLSIVAAIVAAHRGRVALESVPGEGTVVTVQLPRSVDGGQDPPAVEAIGDDPAEDDPEVAISGP